MANETLHVIAPRLNIRSFPTINDNEPVDTLTHGDTVVVSDVPEIETQNRIWRKIVEGKANHIDKFVNELFDGVQHLSRFPPIRNLRQPSRPRQPSVNGTNKSLFDAKLRGLHGEAGGQIPKAAEIDAFQKNGIQIAFLNGDQLNVANEIVTKLRGAGVNHFVVRATVTPPEIRPDDSPDEKERKRQTVRDLLNQFVERTTPKLKQFRDALGGSEFFVQIHNEPNLAKEGWGSRWQDGAEFADWFNGVASQYRANPELSGIRIGFSPMSPGHHINEIRMAETAFVGGAVSAIRTSDWVGVHAYWTEDADGNPQISIPAEWRTRFRGKRLLATEVGPVDGVKVTANAVRRVYRQFEEAGIAACMWLSHDNWEDDHLPGAAPPPWITSSWTNQNILL